MKLATLQFRSLQILWNYRVAIKTDVFEINTNNKSLPCYFNEDQLELGTKLFGARVLQNEPASIKFFN